MGFDITKQKNKKIKRNIGSYQNDRQYDYIILAAVAVLFFLSAAILSVGMPKIFISPDETANFFFASQVAENTRLYELDPMNLIIGDVLHPRSIISIEGRLVPVSFVGLPVIYGIMGKMISVGAIVFLTPLFAVFGLFAWRGTVERVFNRRVALLSSILLAVHPAWWYYTSRSMMHNVLFVCFVIFSVWFWVARPFRSVIDKRRSACSIFQDLDILLSGIMLGLALFVRTSELFWIFPGAAMLIIFFWKKIKWQQILLFGLSVLLSLSPVFFINRSLYGDPLTFGYTVELPREQNVAEVELAESDSSVLPFGFDARAIARHVWDYGLDLFWWITVFVLVGLFVLVGRKNSQLGIATKRYRWAYHTIFIISGLFLATIYGSWTFHDNPDPDSLTIANSYVRYWLPVFVMTTVYAAGSLDWLREKVPTKLGGVILSSALLILITGLSIRGTFFAPEDGLIQVRTNLLRYNEIKESVLELTEADSVIIVDRADKIFFPDRAVLYPLRDEKTYELMPRIALRTQIYYYGITFPDTDIEYLNDRKLAELGLRIDLIESFDEESLYKISQAL